MGYKDTQIMRHTKVRIHDPGMRLLADCGSEAVAFYEVSEASRHNSLKPTQRYAHLELAHLRDTHDEVGRVRSICSR